MKRKLFQLHHHISETKTTIKIHINIIIIKIHIDGIIKPEQFSDFNVPDKLSHCELVTLRNQLRNSTIDDHKQPRKPSSKYL
jgi:hypothetical protein